MRIIEKEMLEAIYQWKNWKKDNTKVEIYDNESDLKVYLYNNLIAKIKKHTHALYLYDGGWKSVTTKSRLNALLYGRPQHVFQKDFEWFVSDSIKNEIVPFYRINELNLLF